MRRQRCCERRRRRCGGAGAAARAGAERFLAHQPSALTAAPFGRRGPFSTSSPPSPTQVASASARSLSSSFRSIADTVSQMQDALLTMQMKLERTDMAVNGVARSLHEQAPVVERMERRMHLLETSLVSARQVQQQQRSTRVFPRPSPSLSSYRLFERPPSRQTPFAYPSRSLPDSRFPPFDPWANARQPPCWGTTPGYDVPVPPGPTSSIAPMRGSLCFANYQSPFSEKLSNIPEVSSYCSNSSSSCNKGSFQEQPSMFSRIPEADEASLDRATVISDCRSNLSSARASIASTVCREGCRGSQNNPWDQTPCSATLPGSRGSSTGVSRRSITNFQPCYGVSSSHEQLSSMSNQCFNRSAQNSSRLPRRIPSSVRFRVNPSNSASSMGRICACQYRDNHLFPVRKSLSSTTTLSCCYPSSRLLFSGGPKRPISEGCVFRRGRRRHRSAPNDFTAQNRIGYLNKAGEILEVLSQPCVREAAPERVVCPPPLSKRQVLLGKNLLNASQDGRAEAVRNLLDAGADVNFVYGSHWAPLHRAAAKGHAHVVGLLLKRGANVAATVSGFTALHMAAYDDLSGRSVTLLLEAGADPNTRNPCGRTPLHYAAQCGNEAAVRALLLAGACKGAHDKDGRTPLDVAKTHCVRRLLTGARLQRSCPPPQPPQSELPQPPSPAKRPGGRRRYPDAPAAVCVCACAPANGPEPTTLDVCACQTEPTN